MPHPIAANVMRALERNFVQLGYLTSGLLVVVGVAMCVGAWRKGR